jgi:S-adenosylmethionine:tRNA ribosyltransferase-isomerase
MIDHPGGSARTFTLSDFDFSLPPALIAQHPAPSAAPRACSTAAPAAHRPHLSRLPGLLRAGDLLVFNDTRVVKARIFGEKASGGKLELLIERVLTGHEVVAHMKVSKKPQSGSTVHMAGGRQGGGFDACCWAAGLMKTARCSALHCTARPARAPGS